MGGKAVERFRQKNSQGTPYAHQVAISDFFDPHYGDRFLHLLSKD
jgi:hypothetical protein